MRLLFTQLGIAGLIGILVARNIQEQFDIENGKTVNTTELQKYLPYGVDFDYIYSLLEI